MASVFGCWAEVGVTEERRIVHRVRSVMHRPRVGVGKSVELWLVIILWIMRCNL